MPGDLPHMSPDEFRTLGRRMVDFIADYWDSVERLPPRSNSRPGDVIAALPDQPPRNGLSSTPSHGEGVGGGFDSTASACWDPVFSDVSSIILPALTHWQSPNFFAFFPANASFPAILGEMLSAGLGVQGDRKSVV